MPRRVRWARHHVLREMDLWVWVLGAQAGGGLPLEILKRGLDCIAGLEAGQGARIRNKR